MMLYPPMAALIDKVGSSYLLVNVVARRARDISAKAEEEEDVLVEKPVSTAINEIYSGRLEVEETDA
ncbi:MAG: DNA-directed RNA polymerase subunit omega [Oscillospiraceae bacterium]|nr:DNA-directed RNA polymerase subunit omega [Oscillospiraceae bacterium]MBR6207570.1 DNA-directed RNA polymerase subunit omega [Oscillospiraceae bacterium]